jgi:GH15 family glucan-1,4-alpha-glucosidase
MRDDGGPRMRAYSLVVIGALLAFLAGGFGWSQHRRPMPELVTDDAARHLAAARPDLAAQALSDLRALTLPSGAVLAGPHGPWAYVWPRDASFAAAAYCATGDVGRGLSVLGFLERVHPRSGRWAARYEQDGSGPVADRRGPQLDGSGWVPWAAGFCAASGATDDALRGLWPMVRQSAEHTIAELHRNGLPKPSADYWERREKRLTLGTVAPLVAGLRAAATIADRLTTSPDTGDRWRAAADRLQGAVDKRFGRLGYPRDSRGGADSIVTTLGPPFSPARPQVGAAIRRSQQLLTLPNGGVTPGQDWRADGIAWTPSTALFGLSAAARGDRATAERVLRFLDDYRTPTGAVPEKVTPSRNPAGEAPLAWTSALVVLTDAALARPLPVAWGN